MIPFIIYTVGVALVGLGFGFCWGWAEGRRKLRAELDTLYRERIEDAVWPETKMIHPLVAVVYDETKTVQVRHPLYDQEQER